MVTCLPRQASLRWGVREYIERYYNESNHRGLRKSIAEAADGGAATDNGALRRARRSGHIEFLQPWSGVTATKGNNRQGKR